MRMLFYILILFVVVTVLSPSIHVLLYIGKVVLSQEGVRFLEWFITLPLTVFLLSRDEFFNNFIEKVKTEIKITTRAIRKVTIQPPWAIMPAQRISYFYFQKLEKMKNELLIFDEEMNILIKKIKFWSGTILTIVLLIAVIISTLGTISSFFAKYLHILNEIRACFVLFVIGNVILFFCCLFTYFFFIMRQAVLKPRRIIQKIKLILPETDYTQ